MTGFLKHGRIGLVLALVALLPVACLSGNSSQNSSSNYIPGGSIVQRILAGWPTLDPQSQGSTDGDQIITSMYDYLLALRGSEVVPYLATSWSQTPTSVKFNLRRDATCSDGAPVTATVVANSFKRLLLTVAPTYGAVMTSFGPPPYTITGDDAAATLSVTIGKPRSGLLYAFSTSNPSSAVVCPKGLANPSQLATTPAGSGPFTLTSAVAGDSAILTARPDWHWGPDGISAKSSGFPQSITFKVISNDTTAANLLLTGGLDVAQIIGSDNTRLLADHSLIHHAAHSYFATDVMFNLNSAHPTSDEVVRRAISAALDPKAFALATYSGFARPATSILASDAQCYDPTTKSLMPSPSVAKAKQIMSEGGYQQGGDGAWQDKSTRRPLTIVILGSASENNGSDYLADAVSAAGFSVRLNKTDRAGKNAAILAPGGNFDVAILIPITTAAPDPNGGGSLGLISGPPRPAGQNLTQRDIPEIDAEAAAANAATGAESCKHWANFQQAFLKNKILWPAAVPDYQWYGRGVDFVAAPNRLTVAFLRRVR